MKIATFICPSPSRNISSDPRYMIFQVQHAYLQKKKKKAYLLKKGLTSFKTNNRAEDVFL